MKSHDPWDDPNDPGNAEKYRTRKKCIVHGCPHGAGTRWGPHWCPTHNAERIRRINKGFEAVLAALKE